MPGAWELAQHKKVLLYTLHTDVTTVAWAYGLRNLILPGDVMGVSGMPYDHGRNSAVQRCLQDGYEWLFSLDSDVIPPRDAVLRLLSHNLPVVSGLYSRRSPPHGIPVMLKGGQWVTDYVPGSLIEVELVGAGCLLVHRSVFEKIPHQRPGKPWYDWRVDMQGHMPQGECMSEDFTWNLHIRRHGVRIMVDTGVVCRHVGFGESTHNSFVPLNTTPHT